MSSHQVKILGFIVSFDWRLFQIKFTNSFVSVLYSGIRGYHVQINLRVNSANNSLNITKRSGCFYAVFFSVVLNLENMHCPSDELSSIRIAMVLVFCIVSRRLVCLFVLFFFFYIVSFFFFIKRFNVPFNKGKILTTLTGDTALGSFSIVYLF